MSFWCGFVHSPRMSQTTRVQMPSMTVKKKILADIFNDMTYREKLLDQQGELKSKAQKQRCILLDRTLSD